jgi:hypothetical protein
MPTRLRRHKTLVLKLLRLIQCKCLCAQPLTPNDCYVITLFSLKEHQAPNEEIDHVMCANYYCLMACTLKK